MRHLDDGEKTVNSFAAQFAIIEKRVQALVAENEGLKVRVHGLEKELAQAACDAEQLKHYNGDKQQIREKIERVLQQLDSVELKK